MARVDDTVASALKSLPSKPDAKATSGEKRHYSALMSAALAGALAQELRKRGLVGVRPSSPGDVGLTGAGQRIAGGIGAKQIDVTCSTEESGLLVGISIKSINFRDNTTNNYQKNLINRRGDLLIEAVTLHRRFPYAVLIGMLVLDVGAEQDGTAKRRSTFTNAFPRLRIFTGRKDPAGRDEQFERLYILLVQANQFKPEVRCYCVDDPTQEIPLSDAMDDIMSLIVERNFDFYESDGKGNVRKERAKGK